MWKSIGRNKRSVAVDLRTADGQDLVRRLASECDVVVANTRPHTLTRWGGLDYEALRAVNPPGLVMLHITGFGLAGPKSTRPGFGTLGEAMSGFAHTTGESDGPPTLPSFMLADGIASLNAAYAVLMALYHRDVHDGGGQLIDINLVDPLARLLEQSLLAYDRTGAVPPPQREPLGDLGSPATPIARATTGGSRCPAALPPSRCGCSRPSGGPTFSTTPTSPIRNVG